MGAAPAMYAGGAAAAGSSGTSLVFAAPHGLAVGQGVSCNGEIRFVTAIVSATAVQVNAPFSSAPAAGDRDRAVHFLFSGDGIAKRQHLRLLGSQHGAAADSVRGGSRQDDRKGEWRFSPVRVRGNGARPARQFQFTAGEGQLSSFPAEPALGAFDYSIVPGNMGEAWLGSTPGQFYTITSGTFQLDNGLEMRSKEFGTNLPQAIAPGPRTVTAAFSLYELDDAATQGLYQAARQQSPISVMFQLGQQTGQVVGVYMMSVVPVVPEFDDSDNRLQWKFQGSKAQGTANNEIVVAFG
jgi:hypothetical protein